MKLTKAELQNLYYIVKSQINWQEGGCFGNGDTITDKKGMKSAMKILEKISIELDTK